MHDELLKNNGTVGVQVYGQNFYINPTYQGETYKIEPGQKLLLEDVLELQRNGGVQNTIHATQDNPSQTWKYPDVDGKRIGGFWAAS